MRRPVRPLSTRRPQRAQITPEQLASLSHDFRTPLNGVLGMARLLEGTRLTAEQRAYAAALRESGQHLLTLVNDVLDFAKLGAGAVELSPHHFDPENLLRGVCELLAPRARERGLEIAWSAPEGFGRILADEGRLRQILLNFAGNAIKFTRQGGVLLSVEAEGGLVRFVVGDTGPGVDPAERERIFEPFAQAGGREADLAGAGLGLAIARRLALAMDGTVHVEDASARMVGGGAAFVFQATPPRERPARHPPLLTGRRVGVASPNPIVRLAATGQIAASGGEGFVAADVAGLLVAAGEADVLLLDHALAGTRLLKPPAGRTAIVLLAAEERGLIDRYRKAGFAGYLIKPLRRASLAERVLIAAGAGVEAPGAPGDERVAEAAAPGARVLLVEDHPINALLARTLLIREGCVVDHAQGGEEALTAAAVSDYDLILMDMRMPGLSGEDTARRLRASGVTTPIVALTANAFEDDRKKCLAAGMDDFLVKPLSPDALRGALTRWALRGWTLERTQAKLG
jgi:CheY-like chemotaxis protein